MIVTACITLASGIVMSFFSFFLSVDHIISDSVLWYFAQCLMYAASAFGIAAYIHAKFDHIGSLIYADNKEFQSRGVDKKHHGKESQHS